MKEQCSNRIHRASSERYALVGILGLGFILRVIRLGSNPYWHDEVHVLIKSEHLESVLLTGEFVSNHPPLFTTLVAAWRALGLGANEWTMRALPLLLGLCGIVAIYWVGKRLISPSAGLVAALLLAISPFHVLHSQDLKVYVLLPFTGTLMVYALYRATERNRPHLWALYGLSVAVACYSEVFSAFLLVGVNLWFLTQLRGKINRLPGWFLANALGVGAFLPYAPVLLKRTDLMLVQSQNWWVPKPTLWSVLFYLKALAFGYSDTEPLFKIAMAVLVCLAVAGAVVVWKANRPTALLLVMWFVVPISLVFVVSHIMESIFLYRALLPFAIPYYLLVATALSRLKVPTLRAGSLVLLAALVALPLLQHYREQYSTLDQPHRPGIHPPQGYDEAAHCISEHWTDGDVVVHASACTWLPFYWYGLEEYPQSFGSVASEFIDGINAGNPPTTAREEFHGYFPQHVQTIVAQRRRVWFVFSEWERKYLSGNARNVWRWLDAHFIEVEHREFKGIELLLYETGKVGEPTRIVKRDQDDGVSSEISYTGAYGVPYLKHQPDAGLVPASLDNRRGALVLSFAKEEKADTKRTISFSARNRTSRKARCTIVYLASDALLDVTSLRDAEPEASVWRVQHQYNPNPPPKAYEMAVATARFDGEGVSPGPSGQLAGSVALQPGTYATSVYVLGTPGVAQQGRAQLSVSVGDTEILAPASAAAREPFAWQWLPGGAVRVSAADSLVPVRITAAPTLECETSHADIAYVAFRRLQGATGPAPNGILSTDWPGEVTLEPGEEKVWSVDLDPDTRRMDVWAYEHGEDGKAYRISWVIPVTSSEQVPARTEMRPGSS